MAQRRSAAVCTVSSPSYFHLAKTLMKSIIENEWELDRYVFLVDSSEDLPRFTTDLFKTVPLEGLFGSLPLVRLFRYTNAEMAMSLKPKALQYLFNLGYEKAIFLDADTLVLGPADPILSRLDSHDGLITPHLTEPISDGFPPDDLDIIRTGAYNTGFVAVKASGRGRRFVEWWSEKLDTWCLFDNESGMFGDQKIVDMVPSLFPGIVVDRSDGINVAFWNLPQRRPFERRNNVYFCGDTRVSFFHFQGFDPSNPAILSKGDLRFKLNGCPRSVRELFDDYAGRLAENGLQDFGQLPYRYNYFSDGTTPIPPIIRKMYRDYAFIQDRFGDNPFDMSRDPGFRTTYNRRIQGSHSPVTLLASQLYKADVQVRDPFESLQGVDQEHLAQRFLSVIAPAQELSDVFVEPIRAMLNQPLSHGNHAHATKSGEAATGVAPNGTLQQHSESSLDRENTGPIRDIKDRPTTIDRLLAKTIPPTLRVVKRLQQIPAVRNAGRRLLDEVVSQRIVWKTIAEEFRRPNVLGSAGINVVGWLQADTPMGELARSTIRAASAMDIPISDVNLNIGCDAPVTETVPEHMTPAKSVTRNVNIFHVNGYLFQVVYHELGARYLGGRYNIGYWDWETPYLPESWIPYIRSFHEIWTPSTFCMESLGRAASIPVIRMPSNVSVEVPQGIGRRDLGLPEDGFVFLCRTDLSKNPERENALGCLKAFTNAFDGSGRNVHLCMAIRDSTRRPDMMETIDQYADRSKGIILLKDRLDRAHMNGLVNCCDSFVSLHRSVGFGLDMAEAMYLGKTVIATGWSGNTDYMNVGNSLPVRFDLVEITGNAEPAAKGHFWAEPDLDHAAELMKSAVEDQSLREFLGRRARQEIRANLSPKRTGEMLKQRLEQISLMTGYVSQ